jgi:hypothetical protein
MYKIQDLREIARCDDYIFSDGFLDLANSISVAYVKADLFFKREDWRGIKGENIITARRRSEFAFIGHSDIGINHSKCLTIKCLNFKRVFATNVEIRSGEIVSLPLGLTNLTRESALHQIYGNRHVMRNAIFNLSKKDISIYSNFLNSTNPKIRIPVSKIAEDLPYIHKGRPEPSIEGRVKFLDDIARSDMVLCPRGNGLDTHRFWEALYLGSIPVVRKNEFPPGILAEGRFPAIVLESWEELTNFNKMAEHLDLQKQKIHNPNFLRMSYWKKIVREQIGI